MRTIEDIRREERQHRERVAELIRQPSPRDDKYACDAFPGQMFTRADVARIGRIPPATVTGKAAWAKGRNVGRFRVREYLFQIVVK